MKLQTTNREYAYIWMIKKDTLALFQNLLSYISLLPTLGSFHWWQCPKWNGISDLKCTWSGILRVHTVVLEWNWSAFPALDLWKKYFLLIYFYYYTGRKKDQVFSRMLLKIQAHSKTWKLCLNLDNSTMSRALWIIQIMNWKFLF